MMNLNSFICLLYFFVTSSLLPSRGYTILGLFPFVGLSHTVVYKSIMKELARRGHTVHVVSHYPLEKPLENYVDFSLLGSAPLRSNVVNIHTVAEGSDFLFLRHLMIPWIACTSHSKIMVAESMQRLLNSTESYDLIITESFIVDMTLGFVHKFKAPFIYLSASSITPWTAQLFANPLNPAYIPIYPSDYSNRMSLWERVHNTLSVACYLLAWRSIFVPMNERYLKEFFGSDMPPLLDIAHNANLILVNSHYSIYGAKPAVPGVIDVAGVHVAEANKLPKDIEEFIDSSPKGVIYFCMGSFLRTATMSEIKRKAFLDAFSRLQERVLWKYEDENITTLPDNVKIKKWMPQRDILAHPKVKLFISHGGLLSTIEALHEGKPVIGLPIYYDQKMNIRSLEAEGMAVYLQFKSVSNETVLQSIYEALKPQYAENAKRLSSLYHDRPMKPMDTAIYWIEHTIRHKRNPRLRSPAVDMPYYQYLLVDVIAIIILVIMSMIFVFVYTCLKIRQFFQDSKSKKLKEL